MTMEYKIGNYTICYDGATGYVENIWFYCKEVGDSFEVPPSAKAFYGWAQNEIDNFRDEEPDALTLAKIAMEEALCG